MPPGSIAASGATASPTSTHHTLTLPKKPPFWAAASTQIPVPGALPVRRSREGRSGATLNAPGQPRTGAPNQSLGAKLHKHGPSLRTTPRVLWSPVRPRNAGRILLSGPPNASTAVALPPRAKRISADTLRNSARSEEQTASRNHALTPPCAGGRHHSYPVKDKENGTWPATTTAAA